MNRNTVMFLLIIFIVASMVFTAFKVVQNSKQYRQAKAEYEDIIDSQRTIIARHAGTIEFLDRPNTKTIIYLDGCPEAMKALNLPRKMVVK